MFCVYVYMYVYMHPYTGNTYIKNKQSGELQVDPIPESPPQKEVALSPSQLRI